MSSAEIIREIRRLHTLLAGRALNNYYTTLEIPLTVEHPEDSPYLYTPPSDVSINSAIFLPANTPYKYRLNALDWIQVAPKTMLKYTEFDINTLEVSNEAGEGSLYIILEGRV